MVPSDEERSGQSAPPSAPPSAPEISPENTEKDTEKNTENGVPTLSYPGAALVVDLVRGLPGGALSALVSVFAFTGGQPIVGTIFGAAAALFLWLLGLAFVRSRLAIQLFPEGLRLASGEELAWGRLKELRLRYWAGFRQRRRGEGGMLALTLEFSATDSRRARRVRLESSCLNFRLLAKASRDAALAEGALLDAHSRHNLEALRLPNGES